jgi:DNA-binding HxlR family transcriptional regulator
MPKPIERLISFFHYSWSLPVLTELQHSTGARFVTLVNRLQISPNALSRTLSAHKKAGWLQRNPGYGHPLRPEYILTSTGQALGPICQQLLSKISALKIEETALRKWSLPLIAIIGKRELRFLDLRKSLPQITPRALTQALKDLQAACLLERIVQETYPPRVSYKLSAQGRTLLPLLEELLKQL